MGPSGQVSSELGGWVTPALGLDRNPGPSWGARQAGAVREWPWIPQKLPAWRALRIRTGGSAQQLLRPLPGIPGRKWAEGAVSVALGTTAAPTSCLGSAASPSPLGSWATAELRLWVGAGWGRRHPGDRGLSVPLTPARGGVTRAGPGAALRRVGAQRGRRGHGAGAWAQPRLGASVSPPLSRCRRGSDTDPAQTPSPQPSRSWRGSLPAQKCPLWPGLTAGHPHPAVG